MGKIQKKRHPTQILIQAGIGEFFSSEKNSPIPTQIKIRVGCLFFLLFFFVENFWRGAAASAHPFWARGTNNKAGALLESGAGSGGSETPQKVKISFFLSFF